MKIEFLLPRSRDRSPKVLTLKDATIRWDTLRRHRVLRVETATTCIVPIEEAFRQYFEGTTTLDFSGTHTRVLECATAFPFYGYSNAGHALAAVVDLAHTWTTKHPYTAPVIVEADWNRNPFLHSVFSLLTRNSDRRRVLRRDEVLKVDTLLLSDSLWAIPNYFDGFTKRTLDLPPPAVEYKIQGLHYHESVEWFRDVLGLEFGRPPARDNAAVAVLKLSIAEQRQQTPTRAFDDPSLVAFFRQAGVELLSRPEQLPVGELYQRLYSAPVVVLSWGCSGYIQRLFVRPDAKVALLAHEEYHAETDTLDANIFHHVPQCASLLLFPNLPSRPSSDLQKSLQVHLFDKTART